MSETANNPADMNRSVEELFRTRISKKTPEYYVKKYISLIHSVDEYCRNGRLYSGSVFSELTQDKIRMIKDVIKKDKNYKKWNRAKWQDIVKAVNLFVSVFERGTDYTAVKADGDIPKPDRNTDKNVSAGPVVSVTAKTIKSEEEMTIFENILVYSSGNSNEVCVPDGVEIIGRRAFANNINLCRIHLPDSVKFIDDHAFSGCSSLAEINITENIKYIGYRAFADCPLLENISPDDDTVIGSSAFKGCDGLADSEGFVIVNDVLYDYMDIQEEITVPGNVKQISSCAFRNSLFIKSVTLPDGLTRIGDRAFEGCTKLEEMDIPKGVSVIGEKAFSKCDGYKYKI